MITSLAFIGYMPLTSDQWSRRPPTAHRGGKPLCGGDAGRALRFRDPWRDGKASMVDTATLEVTEFTVPTALVGAATSLDLGGEPSRST